MIHENKTGQTCKFTTAGNWFQQSLHTEARFHMDVRDYARFVNLMHTWVQNPTQLLFNQSRLRLYHPVSPDPRLALRFLRQAVNSIDPFQQDILGAANSRVQFMAFWYIVLAAQVLHAQGSVAEAREVIDIGAQHYPAPFCSPGSSHDLQPTDDGYNMPRSHNFGSGLALDSTRYDAEDRAREWQRIQTLRALG
ncbi:hypothetical protein LTR86_005239 [Recurvomyces mirabilis]|nr:hypothetical protein LTR86_005239 [Recurvomyces mirabilis]